MVHTISNQINYNAVLSGLVEIPKRNTLGCPQCGSELCDQLPKTEIAKIEKTVKCTNCEFTGKRKGYLLVRIK